MRVTVVDSVCGSGKSSAAINMMKEREMDSFIYITPFLDEIKRVEKALSGHRKFYEPINKGRGKLDSLKELLAKGRSIATTHALFTYFDDEVIGLIESYNYTLILDEVVEVVSVAPISGKDAECLIKGGVLKIEEDGIVSYVEDSKYKGKFMEIVDMAKSNRLISYGGSTENGNTLMLWHFPIEIFKAFKESYILTYLFDCQVQAYYFKLHGLEYEKKSAKLVDGEYQIVDYYNSESNDLFKRIRIFKDVAGEDSLNKIGDDKTALSKGWHDKNRGVVVQQLGKNAYNFFRHKLKLTGKDCMWTSFAKEEKKNNKTQPIVQVASYGKRWLPCNARATNDYREVSACAYLVNRFFNPIIMRFFEKRGIEVNEDEYALSELIQWIYRSRLRSGGDIDLYIPSKRMRELLGGYIHRNSDESAMIEYAKNNKNNS